MDKKMLMIIGVIVAIVVVVAAAYALGAFNGGGSDTPTADQDAKKNKEALTKFLDGENEKAAIYPTRLMVLGNADLNDIIDDQDIKKIQDIIKNPNYDYVANYFADANYDGLIDQKDIDMVKQLKDYNGYKGKINYLNVDYYIRTYDNSGPLYTANTLTQTLEMLCILVPESIVATDDRCHKYGDVSKSKNGTFYKEFESIIDYGDENHKDKIGNIGDRRSYTPEHILEVSRKYADGKLTVMLQSSRSNTNLEDAFAGTGTQAVRLPGWEKGCAANGVLTMGFLFHAFDKAQEYIAWHDGVMSQIEKAIEKIPENQRPKAATVTVGNTDDPELTVWPLLYKPAGEYRVLMKTGCQDITTQYCKAQGVPDSQYSVDISRESMAAFYQQTKFDIIIGSMPGPFNTTPDGIAANYQNFHQLLDTVSGGKAKLIYLGWIYGSGGPMYLGAIAAMANLMYDLDLDVEKITNDGLKIMGVYGTGEHQWTYDKLESTFIYSEDL